ncbi:hypothetical protein BGZ63DRAFT_429046 [Mariannaea sp. PMI_226]|nr:hypothetical protein BGZ63DRAFT_429046 [Mariannaea sp. PMI_226]
MGLKHFNLDVKEAARGHWDRVSDIRKGDSEGEIVFTYSPQDMAPVELQALATDVDSYPKGSSFLIFTSSDHVEPHVVARLERLSDSVAGKTVSDAIQLLSTNLTSLLASAPPDSPGGLDIDSEDTDMNDESDALDFTDGEEEWDFDLGSPSARPQATVLQYPSPIRHLESWKRLKRHLRQLSNLGIFVSTLGASPKARSLDIFSLAIHVSKLNIPAEALEAWDLQSSDYVVMLVRLRVGYLPFQEIFSKLPDHSAIQFRFGKCANPRPSRATAIAAFNETKIAEGLYASQKLDDMDDESSGDADFLPIFISGSLDSLLNQEFPGLLLLRRRQGLSWDQAQIHQSHTRKSAHLRTQRLDADDDVADNVGIPEDILKNATNIDGLQHDYVLDNEEEPNISLIAMQFGLQRLVQCTKYCMVCHQRTNATFEAIKPYVCDDPLCLYQYLALGFGQSIENEIINNPYVVDLLVSFFYSAARADRLRAFPKGLGLKGPYPGSTLEPAPHLEVEVCFVTKTIKFNPDDFPSYRTIKEGHCVLLVLRDTETIPTHSILFGGIERHNCLITSCHQCSYQFQIISTRTGPPNLEQLPEDLDQGTQATNPQEGWRRVMLFKYEKDLDDLQPNDRNAALLNMAYNIPSVLDMREYLMEQPSRLLSSYKNMDVYTLALLKWIVASNRSFIVQDAPVPDIQMNSDASLSVNQNRVIGMDERWMQFRFAQGSPDKEQVFIDELERHDSINGEKKPHPSLFLWHGSPIGNWHSIIRTGLDFVDSSHGRAFGNGVYFSNHLTVSQGYSGILDFDNIPRTGAAKSTALTTSVPARSNPSSFRWTGTWPNSQLVASSAISVCEVINEPSQFVSNSPHYVVDKLEWIQCRYLFVCVEPSQEAKAQPFPKPLAQETTGYLPQDPLCHLLGPGQTPLQIPFSAIPARRRHALNKNADENGQPSVLVEGDHLRDEWMLAKDDIDRLSDSEDETLNNLVVRQRRRSSVDSGMEMARPLKLTTTMQEERKAHSISGSSLTNTIPDHIGGFCPGALDLDSLPKLLEPDFAASSPAALRSLNREIKELQRTQSRSELRTLGWYIDFDKLSNLFHWIVELHSFDESLPLVQDMKRAGHGSVVLEIRFGSSFPLSPPFVRVVRPRFLPFSQGGGGHVTMGGAICSELLTNSGWSPALSLEKVFLDVRVNLSDMDPPARLDTRTYGGTSDYGFGEAVDAFRRAAIAHGWQLPNMEDMTMAVWRSRDDSIPKKSDD